MGIIYRCGWCGNPVTKQGGPLAEVKWNSDATFYLEKHADADVIKVDGFCCPHGNSTYTIEWPEGVERIDEAFT